MARKTSVPKFKTEAEEADWVFRHQPDIAAVFESPGPRTTPEQIVARARHNVTIELSSIDFARSRKLASNARVSHRVYIKRLLRRAIADDARKLA